MFDAFLTVLGQMLIVLGLMLIGYLFNSKKMIPHEAEKVLSKLVTNLFLPSLTLNTFLTRCTPQNLKENSSLILYGAVICLAGIAVSYPLSAILGRKDRNIIGVIRYSIVGPNTGGVGTPLVLAMYGTMGLFQFNLFTQASVIVCYSWGVAQLIRSEDNTGFRQNLRMIFNPNFIAMIVGAILGLTEIAPSLPGFMYDGFERIGGCYTVVSLIVTGFVIADYPIKQIFGDKLVYLMTAVRLLIIPLTVLSVLKLAGASSTLILMACLMVTCPCGMNVVVYPAAYGQDSRFGASLVLISSTLSVLTVPLIYSLFCV